MRAIDLRIAAVARRLSEWDSPGTLDYTLLAETEACGWFEYDATLTRL